MRLATALQWTMTSPELSPLSIYLQRCGTSHIKLSAALLRRKRAAADYTIWRQRASSRFTPTKTTAAMPLSKKLTNSLVYIFQSYVMQDHFRSSFLITAFILDAICHWLFGNEERRRPWRASVWGKTLLFTLKKTVTSFRKTSDHNPPEEQKRCSKKQQQMCFCWNFSFWSGLVCFPLQQTGVLIPPVVPQRVPHCCVCASCFIETSASSATLLKFSEDPSNPDRTFRWDDTRLLDSQTQHSAYIFLAACLQHQAQIPVNKLPCLLVDVPEPALIAGRCHRLAEPANMAASPQDHSKLLERWSLFYSERPHCDALQLAWTPERICVLIRKAVRDPAASEGTMRSLLTVKWAFLVNKWSRRSALSEPLFEGNPSGSRPVGFKPWTPLSLLLHDLETRRRNF